MSDQESSNTDRRETMSVQEAIDRAKNEPGEDLEALQSLVIENGRPIDAALFALAVQSGVNHGSAPDTRDVEERVFRSGDAFAAFELASEVKGVDRVRAQEVTLESDDPESCRHALRLAKSDFPGIDRDALKEKVLRSGSGLTLVRLAETFPDVGRDRVARGVLERGGPSTASSSPVTSSGTAPRSLPGRSGTRGAWRTVSPMPPRCRAPTAGISRTVSCGRRVSGTASRSTPRPRGLTGTVCGVG